MALCLGMESAGGGYLPVVGPPGLRFKMRPVEPAVAVVAVPAKPESATGVIEPESTHDPLQALVSPFERTEGERETTQNSEANEALVISAHTQSLVDPQGNAALLPSTVEPPVTAQMLVELFRPAAGTNGAAASVVIPMEVPLSAPKAPASSSATYIVQ